MTINLKKIKTQKLKQEITDNQAKFSNSLLLAIPVYHFFHINIKTYN